MFLSSPIRCVNISHFETDHNIPEHFLSYMLSQEMKFRARDIWISHLNHWVDYDQMLENMFTGAHGYHAMSMTDCILLCKH
jgi:hypothetical protein